MLEGIRVIDFTTLLPGPYATLRLSDLGAEIIKVEPPRGGDAARYTGPRVGDTGIVFLANNRNKRTVRIDLSTEEGRKAATSLIEQADVVIEGFRPGVMKKFDLHYEAVQQVNAAIVYCSLTGYGQTGPMATLAGHDLNYMAQSGVLSQLRDAQGRPIVPSHQFADLIGGIAASEAILAALVQRGKTGTGAYLDVAMTDALIGMMTHHALANASLGLEYGIEELTGRFVCYHLYETADGRFMSLAALEPKFWHAFCQAIGHTEWQDAQFSEAVDGETTYEAVKHLFASRTMKEWTELGVLADCCLTPVLMTSEVLGHPHTLARDIPMRMDVYGVGPLLQLDTHAGGHKGAGTRAMPAPPIAYP